MVVAVGSVGCASVAEATGEAVAVIPAGWLGVDRPLQAGRMNTRNRKETNNVLRIAVGYDSHDFIWLI